jgi:hypothetical protein
MTLRRSPGTATLLMRGHEQSGHCIRERPGRIAKRPSPRQSPGHHPCTLFRPSDRKSKSSFQRKRTRRWPGVRVRVRLKLPETVGSISHRSGPPSKTGPNPSSNTAGPHSTYVEDLIETYLDILPTLYPTYRSLPISSGTRRGSPLKSGSARRRHRPRFLRNVRPAENGFWLKCQQKR